MTSRYAVRYVNGPIGRWFRARQWAGVTLPVPWWGSLILIWGDEANLAELRHEVLGHVPQVARMGTLRYLVTILYQYARYGHDAAPMEVEARRLAMTSNEQEGST